MPKAGELDEDEPLDPVALREAKKKFILTASFDEQLELLAPPPEPVPIAPRPLPHMPVLPAPPPRPVAPIIGVHRFVASPETHPAWGEVVTRALALELPPWHAQVLFRMALLALHGEGALRHETLGRLCAELDAHLRPKGPLMIGPLRFDAPTASPIAGPMPPGVALFAGLDFPEASAAAQASLIAALCGWAAWHAPSVQAYGMSEASPIDLVTAIAAALDREVQVIPLPAMPTPSPVSDTLVEVLQAARSLVEREPMVAIMALPNLIAQAPIPAAKVVLMQLFARALRTRYALPEPPPDAPGLLAQMTAWLASPLVNVYSSALKALTQLGQLPDARVLGLDLQTRFPGTLANTRDALRRGVAVPRWVVANTQGGDRALVCATLLARLPSADDNVLQALIGLAPPELEPALHETLRLTWPSPAEKAAARAALEQLGRA